MPGCATVPVKLWNPSPRLGRSRNKINSLTNISIMILELTGEVAKAFVEMLALVIIWSTASFAGKYSEGRGREEDIPY